MVSSRVSKRRRGDDSDSDDGGRRNRDRKHSSSRSRSPSPKQKKSRRREKERDPSPPAKDDYAESLSIEETNKLRAKLGLAPLEVDDGSKTREGEDGAMIHIEDGFEFRHKKPENWAEKKKEQEMKEKLELAKKKRQLYEKVLVAKGIAESDSDDDAEGWVEKMRRQEEEKKRAEERAKMLDAMDEEFGVNSLIDEEKAKQEKKKARQAAKQKIKNQYTAGLVVGHSKEAFAGVNDQILVLEDKSVLDEGEEVLVNPNLIDNEKSARNVELKKRKELMKGFDDVDEFGNPKSYGVLTKYDEELDGVQREKFRLDERGGYDLEKDEREERMRRELELAGKTLVSLEMSKPKSYGVLTKYDEELDGVQREKFRLDERGGYDLEKDEREERMRRELELAGKTLVSLEMSKYKVGSEFYTKEEMVAFRKVKKGKKEKSTRKRKILKADDLVPDEPAEGKDLGSRKSRRRRNSDDEEKEDGQAEVKAEVEEGDKSNQETTESSGPWKKATKNAVDLEMLRSIAEKGDSDEEESEDEFGGAGDLADVVIEDDAEEELASVMDKARRLRQVVVKKEDDDVAQKVHQMVSSHNIKMEVDDDESTTDQHAVKDGAVTLDATMEYCRNIGEIPTYGLAGNRTDAIDVSEMKQEVDEEDTVAIKKWKQAQIEKEKRRKERLARKEDKNKYDKPGTSNAIDSDDERQLEEAKEVAYSDEDDDDNDNGKSEYENVLGKEADVTKGVGAMLKLAAQKGYLNDNETKKKTGQNLDHLRNQSKTQIEQGKYDIEDKYAKKLDRLGTTGRGPIMPFVEKKDYKPEVNIHYVDEKGRVMDQKDAYRELSYKFHGRNPGKKQTEKRISRRDKKELLKQMNSSDTPLGTLSKQLKKQEQLQTPYLVLSGSGRSDHTSLKKE
ncbi:hypothetical protein Q1695_001970 [Nippostrongylus brasiliensis]|nr:hypothetical protein Q1695_001970 [Nippostrongylus brasiliensis]